MGDSYDDPHFVADILTAAADAADRTDAAGIAVSKKVLRIAADHLARTQAVDPNKVVVYGEPGLGLVLRHDDHKYGVTWDEVLRQAVHGEALVPKGTDQRCLTHGGQGNWGCNQGCEWATVDLYQTPPRRRE